MKELGDLPYVDFGKRLRALRLQANITTQRELVDLLADKDVYYDYTVVSHWESGRRCPSLQTLIAIIQVLVEAGSIKDVAAANELLRHDFVHSLSLTGLELGDSLFFLRTDAEQRDVHQILEADEGRLVEIHEITGGAPLALKLVVAQARFLDLDLILRQLRQAKGNLYPFIFRQSWAQLPPAAQRLLIYIGRTVVTTAGWEELASVGIAKNEEELMEAVGQLVACSLLNTSFVAGQTRYGVHQLTRQFVNGDLPEIWRRQGLL